MEMLKGIALQGSSWNPEVCENNGRFGCYYGFGRLFYMFFAV